MRKFYKTFYLQIILIFISGFSIGVISICPGIIFGNNRKCFYNILKDSSDGSVKIGTLLLINPNYLLKIKNIKIKYLKILLIGDSWFRKFKWNDYYLHHTYIHINDWKFAEINCTSDVLSNYRKNFCWWDYLLY